MIRIPDLRWAVRFGWAVAAPALFVWLAYEDRDLNVVMGLSAIVCLAGALTWTSKRRSGRTAERRRWLLESMAIGVLAGGMVAPVAVLLILIKISLHSHGTPDFTMSDIAEIVNRLPTWALAGVLCGEALGLLGVSFGRNE
jgi:hypothetical protein